MSVPIVTNVFGYVEYNTINPSLSLSTILAYLEWIGTSEPIALSEDGQVNTIQGYIEYIDHDSLEAINSVSGYVEYTTFEPLEITSIQSYVECTIFDPYLALGSILIYIEWIGTSEPIALSEDGQVNTIQGYIEYLIPGQFETISSILGYVEYLWDGTIVTPPPVTTSGFGPLIWVI